MKHHEENTCCAVKFINNTIEYFKCSECRTNVFDTTSLLNCIPDYNILTDELPEIIERGCESKSVILNDWRKPASRMHNRKVHLNPRRDSLPNQSSEVKSNEFPLQSSKTYKPNRGKNGKPISNLSPVRSRQMQVQQSQPSIGNNLNFNLFSPKNLKNSGHHLSQGTGLL